jgi:ABC-type antimicrobial peptide transport system ATPase subunit
MAGCLSSVEGCICTCVGSQVTIMDADKVVVLDHGLVVEEGHPHDMLVDENGKFTSMVNQTGELEWWWCL